MTKTILITGSTDGIGFEAAKMLAERGNTILLHGRNASKLENTRQVIEALPGHGPVETYVADLSRMIDVEALAAAVIKKHTKLDVLINNAGVFRAPETTTADGLDIRFMVNTIAPYLLTQRLLPLLDVAGRIVNLSSAAQSPVNTKALAGQGRLSDGDAYAQSKLALTMWSRAMAQTFGKNGPAIIAVNPGSMLGSKMVRDNFGVAGGDLRIGADILTRAALDDEFATASGKYFDNDSDQFAAPHPDGTHDAKSRHVVEVIEAVLAR